VLQKLLSWELFFPSFLFLTIKLTFSPLFAFYLIPVAPESVVVPIVSCIFGFPLLALLIICCLRRRAKLARERERQMNYGLQDHAVSLVRFSPIHRLSESICNELVFFFFIIFSNSTVFTF
jgi:hypothetical protein